MKVVKSNKEVEKVVVETVEEFNISLSKQEAMTLLAIVGSLTAAKTAELVESSIWHYPVMKEIVPTYAMDIHNLITTPLYDSLVRELNIKMG